MLQPFLIHCGARCASPRKRQFLLAAAQGKRGLFADRADGAVRVLFTPKGEFPLPTEFNEAAMHDLFDAMWDYGNFLWALTHLGCLGSIVKRRRSN